MFICIDKATAVRMYDKVSVHWQQHLAKLKDHLPQTTGEEHDGLVEKIDFMSMDIEGAQMEALAGFTIEEHKPELVCIEAYAPDRDKILAFFQNHGYERIDRYLEHDQVNWYFTPKRGS